MVSAKLQEPEFWDGVAEYRSAVHPFTSWFAERALEIAASPPGASVVDIAAGTGALTLAAARTGASILATDFAAGMVAAIAAHRMPNVTARQMDGQALDLPNGTFDAAFSIFGVMLFPDWRAGLAELARVVRPGGTGSVVTWAHPAGAGPNLLLAEVVAAHWPNLRDPAPIEGLVALSEGERLTREMRAAGFTEVRIDAITSDFVLDMAQLDAPDTVFGFSPFWPELTPRQRSQVVDAVRAAASPDGRLQIPSTALVATAHR